MQSIRSPYAHRRRAVTLTELLVVMSIIGVIAGLSFVFYQSAMQYGESIAANANAVAASFDQKQAVLKAPLKAMKPATGSKKSGQNPPVYVPNRYLVKLSQAKPHQDSANKVATAMGGSVYSTFAIKGSKYAAIATAPGKTLADLKAHELVEFAEKEPYMYSTVEKTWTGVKRQTSSANAKVSYQKKSVMLSTNVNIPKDLTKIPTTKKSGNTVLINVAVLDTGVDASHPDLNVVYSQGFGAQPNGDDTDGHGTHVAGIIGALGGNDIGVVGVYPGVRIWALRVLGPNGGSAADVIGGINFVTTNANLIDVANLSLGGGFSATVNAAIDAAADAGVIMCVAAGNSGANADNFSPASASKAICVAALGDSNGVKGGTGSVTSAGPDDTMADFSNWGPSVDCIAPGVDILSCWPASLGMSYNNISGTSMACPHVAGLMALYRAGQLRLSGYANTTIPVAPGINGPALIQEFTKANATETIPGILGDPLSYQMINVRPSN